MTEWGRGERPVPQASTKLLPGFAISLAQKFAVSYEYIVGMLADADIDIFRADLITGAMQPANFDIRRNRILVERIRDNYVHLMDKFPHIAMARAEMVLHSSRASSDADLKTQVCLAFKAADGREWFGGIADYLPPRERPRRPRVLKGAAADPTRLFSGMWPAIPDYPLRDAGLGTPRHALTVQSTGTRDQRWAFELVSKLRALARGVAAGNPACQVTALLPIRRLSGDQAIHRRHCRHLLTAALADVAQDGGTDSVDVTIKRQIMASTLAMLDAHVSRSRTVWQSEVAQARGHIEAIFPQGRRRVWNHATRRAIPDRDLRLTEIALDALVARRDPDDYWAAAVYCAWQPDLRLRLTRDSAARIHHVADFWQSVWQLPKTGAPEFESHRDRPDFACPACGARRWTVRSERDNIPWTPTRADIGQPRTLFNLCCRDCGWRQPLLTGTIKS